MIKLLFALSLFVTASVHASEEINFEPVSVAGDYHYVELENEDVRVLEVSILPGETVPFHQHTLKSVFITLQPSELVFRDMNGKIVKEVKPSDFSSLPHSEYRLAAPAPRSVTNVGKVAFRALRVELKSDGGDT